MINKVFILNINSNNEELKKRIWALGIENAYQWEIKPGIKGIQTDLNWSAYANWKLEDAKNPWWNKNLKEGEIGCALSHLKAWEQAYKEGHELVLFLEEDFKPLINLDEIDFSKIEKDIDGFYLGRSIVPEKYNESIKVGSVAEKNNNKEKEYNKQFNHANYSYNTQAYCLTRSGLEKILKYDFLNNIIPSDEFLSATFVEHPRKDIAKLFPPTLKFLACKKDFIDQFSEQHDSLTENSKEISKIHYLKNNYEILDDSDWNAWKLKYINPIMNRANENAYSLMVDHLGHEVYEFPLFTEKFCEEAIALVEQLDVWTYDRHDSYPTTDVLLQDIGLNKIYNKVAEEIIRPLLKHLWTLQGKEWDSLKNENFLARYLPDAQSHLALHHDASDISMVVKLNNEFDGGGTYFSKYGLLANPEKVGTASLHPGQITHRHGARPIYSGRRYILVSFIYKGGPKKK